MNKRKVALLRGAATVLLLAVLLILAGWLTSEAFSPLPPGQGSPSAAGIEAAPEVHQTHWVYQTLNNPDNIPFSGLKTFWGPGDWGIAGDWYVIHNENNDRVPEADCLWPWLFCVPNTGTTSWIHLEVGQTLDVDCGNGIVNNTCAVWALQPTSTFSRVPDLVCQQLIDGCGGAGCPNGIFATKVWWANGRLESQWLLPTGNVAGGTQFDVWDNAWVATSCTQATPTPTVTPTPTSTPVPPTPTPSPTPTSTPVPPTPTPSPTATSTSVPPTPTSTPGCPCPTDTPTPTLVPPTATPTWTPSPTATPGVRRVWLPIVLRAIPQPTPTVTPAPACPAGRILFNGREGGPVYHATLNTFRVEWTLVGGAQPPNALHWRMAVDLVGGGSVSHDWWQFTAGSTPPWQGWTAVPNAAVIEFVPQQVFGDRSAGANFSIDVYPWYSPGNLCAQVHTGGIIDPTPTPDP